jgi:hypothetical protein
MLCSGLRKYSRLAGAMVPMLVGSAAYAATPTEASTDIGAIPGLGVGTQQLSAQDLDGIRGGFDLGPALSVNFAFQQTATVNGLIVQSILVPLTNLTALSGGAQVIVTNNDGMTTTTSTYTAGPGNNTYGVTPVVTPAVTPAATPAMAGGTAPASDGTPAFTAAPASNNNINVTSNANDGLTVVNTQLGQDGLSNVVSNQANNAIVGIESTMNIGITGMSAWLTHQQTSMGMLNDFNYANQGFK